MDVLEKKWIATLRRTKSNGPQDPRQGSTKTYYGSLRFINCYGNNVVQEDFSARMIRETNILLDEMWRASKENKFSVVKYNKLKIEDEIFKYDWIQGKIEKVGTKSSLMKRKRGPQPSADSSQQEPKRLGGEDHQRRPTEDVSQGDLQLQGPSSLRAWIRREDE